MHSFIMLERLLKITNCLFAIFFGDVFEWYKICRNFITFFVSLLPEIKSSRALKCNTIKIIFSDEKMGTLTKILPIVLNSGNTILHVFVFQAADLLPVN